MKLLGWVHQKLAQNSKGQLMNFTGNPSSCYSTGTLTNEQLFHAEPTYSFAQPRKCPKLLNKMKVTGTEEILEEESHDELFRGFLAIGTLGSETLNAEPPTPKFHMPFQNITDKEINITENEVKLMNNEVEKFTGAEAREVTDESSARGSQASVIVFSNKQLDDADVEDMGNSSSCRFQKHLFGNSIQLPATAVGPKKEKMSQEELFGMNDCSYENSTKKYDCADKAHKKSYATHFAKSVLKKLHSTATSCATASRASNDKATKSEAIKRKLPKVLKLKFFQRKVHPEALIGEKHFILAKKDEMTKVSDKSSNFYEEEEEKKKSPEMATSKKESNFGGTTVKRERWIKTDDDYLVLEL